MSFNAIQEYDAATAGNNIDIGGNNIAEGNLPGTINNALRELVLQIRKAVANQGSDIASAGTTDIGAATGQYVKVTGTTTITALGTVNAGTMRWLEFTGILTLSNNGTSLKLPTSANITTAAGDVACFVSLGSGNWKCLGYVRADGTAVATNLTTTGVAAVLTLSSTDAGAAVAQLLDLYRDSATPANSDVLGGVMFNGRDSAANKQLYAQIAAKILDVTSTTEDAALLLQAVVAGALTDILTVGPGLQIGAPTGGDKGAGTVNASGVYIAGHGTVAQVVRDTEVTYTTCGTILPYDNSIPQITEGDEILSVAITPTNASSILRIRVHLPVVGSGAAQSVSAALFVDATANALAVGTGYVPGGSNCVNISFEHTVSAASTSARTYRVRMGAATATDAFLNGDGSARAFGGVATASLEVEEILPQ